MQKMHLQRFTRAAAAWQIAALLCALAFASVAADSTKVPVPTPQQLAWHEAEVGLLRLSRQGSALTNDLVRSSGTVTFGGSLLLTNIGANALAVGNKFTLFSAASRAGIFTSITWPALAPGLGWTNKLSLDGSIEVVQFVNTTPTNLAFSASNGLLSLTWPADHTGWRLQVQTNGLGQGLSTNWFDVSGSTTTNQITVPVTPSIPTLFYRLAYP